MALLLASAGCGDRAAPARSGWTAATYNLNRYGFTERGRDPEARRTEPKPPAEREAVADTIAALRPDVLALQEIGDETHLDELTAALRRRGLDYPHREYLRRGASELNLALLSRFPIAARRPRLMDAYSVGGETLPVLRGFIDVDLDLGGGDTVRVFVAHLKSRVFHPLGQTEMRRNEARLLANHVRQALRENPEGALLVAGDLNDHWNSAALRQLRGDDVAPLLSDLRPADGPGGVWSYANAADDSYDRFDYLLASPALVRRLEPGSARVARDPPAERASDHRPVLAAFRRERAR